jgi:hypothetical protein
MTAVYFLYHIDQNDEGRHHNGKLIGVFATEQLALDAKADLSVKPGFRDYPERWRIYRRTLDRDSWTKGFDKDTHKPLR